MMQIPFDSLQPLNFSPGVLMPFTEQLPEQLALTAIDPDAHANWDSLHATLTQIRADYPFARADVDGYPPFWIASKLEDIRTIARDAHNFKSGMGGMLSNEQIAFEREAGIAGLFRSVVAMNEPDHRKYRTLTQAWFQLKSVRRLQTDIDKLANRWVDNMAQLTPRCDFVRDIAAHYPLFVIMSILGVPDADEPMMLRLTQEYFGTHDSEQVRDAVPVTPQSAFEAQRKVIMETNEYFAHISAARRREPTDDVASVIANAMIDGKPISDIDAMGYYITLAFAGHDTTASSIAGALWALAEDPEQLAFLQKNPQFMPNLVEEAVRWTSPIHQFTRIAARDTEVAGQTVRRGDCVVLSFPSGNRDEAVFDEPFRFRVDRSENPHVGFGFGPHMCLGIHLARMELSGFFSALIPRLHSIALDGTPKRMTTNFVGGPKSLPIRFEFK
jgi:cytochrome P450